MNSTKLPHHLWYYVVQYATIIRNSIYNNSMRDSPRSKVGLLGLDTKSLLPFGQPIIINLNKTVSKLYVRGEKSFALIPDAESYGYLFYLPTKCRVVSSSNFVPIKHDVDIHENEEYDDSIFDDLITSFISTTDDKVADVFTDNHAPSVLSTTTSPPSSFNSNEAPLFIDTLLPQNDAEVDLNIPTTDASTDTQANAKDTIKQIGINDVNQLSLTPVNSLIPPTTVLSNTDSSFLLRHYVVYIIGYFFFWRDRYDNQRFPAIKKS